MIRTALSDRDKRLIEAYNAQDIKSIPALTKEFRLSDNRVRSILKAAGIEPKSEGKRGPKSREPLLGPRGDLIRIVSNKMIARLIELEITVAEFAAKVNLDRSTILAIKEGRTDITLFQVLALAQEEGLTFHEYVTPTGYGK